MTDADHLERLERLARLRETGALSQHEFEREKALLLGQGRTPDAAVEAATHETGKPAPAPKTSAPKRRLALWAAAGLALAGGSGWALADWTGVTPAENNAAQVNAAKAAASNGTSSPAAPSAIRALSAERQVDLAFDAVFGKGEREIRVPEQAAYTYGKGRVLWADFGPILIVEGSGEPYPPAVGTLGIFYLRELPGAKFEEVRRWPDAVTGSAMGNPPQWKIRDDVIRGIVIESTGGGVWQGYACSSTTLTELAPNGPRGLVTFDSHYDSTGAVGEGGESYDGSIANVARNRSFDVRYTGTRPITEHYVRKGREFVRVPGANEEMNESPVPTC